MMIPVPSRHALIFRGVTDTAEPNFTEVVRELPDNMRQASWALIGEGHYNPSSTKCAKIRDPLIRYIHRVLSGSLCQRKDSGGGGEPLRAHLPLLHHESPTHLCRPHAIKKHGHQCHRRRPTPIFFGGWIAKLFNNYIRRTPSAFHKGVGMTRDDLALCRSLKLIIDCNNGLMRFKDARGRVWNQSNPDKVLVIKDNPDCPRHSGSFTGSSFQGGADFPNLHNLYNIMKETLQVTKNAYSLGQSSSSRIGSMEHVIVNMQNITYIWEHMVFRDEEEEEEGEDMDSD
ncbi:hypothetical protein Hdeb2414_s0008g00291561 [Helianthus debilis subsp. tardiflorus]